MFFVVVIRLRSLRLLRVSVIVMRLRMFLLLITFLKASHSFSDRILVICRIALLFAIVIISSVSSHLSGFAKRWFGLGPVPTPSVTKPNCWQQMEWRRFRAAVLRAHTN